MHTPARRVITIIASLGAFLVLTPQAYALPNITSSKTIVTHNGPAVIEEDILTDAVVALESEIQTQKELARIAEEEEAARLAKEAAEKEAARIAARNAGVKERLALTDDMFALLTEADLEALATPPCDAPASEGQDLSNGKLPDTALCSLSFKDHKLRPHASVAFEALNKAYERHFSKPICITDSYRTYESQVRLKAMKPTLAARPGTSNHGWGMAVDLCGGIDQFGTEQHEWMRANAPSFGWHHPTWAGTTGSKPEAWHWEYVAVDNTSVKP